MAASCDAPTMEFEAVVLRWRRLGKRYVFVDVLAEGEENEWQLSCDSGAFVGCERASRLRCVGREERGPSRRGLFGVRCETIEALALLEGDAPSTLVPGKAPGEILCKLWARGGERLCASRSCPYRHRFATEAERVWSEGAKARRLKEIRREADDRDPWVDRDEAADRRHRNENVDDSEKRAHAARHGEFAAWLLRTLGRETLERGPVLDVAGGKGALAWELQCVHGIECVSLDPRARKPLCRRRRKLLRKRRAAALSAGDATAEAPRHVRALLDAVFERSPEGADLLERCSAVVGLHADEATEAIVDAGIKYGKPFAVVPCCVFKDLFPGRPAAVDNHEHFCEYLTTKADGIDIDFLRCVGKNKVVYRHAGAAPRPDVALAQPLDPAYLPAGARHELARLLAQEASDHAPG